MSHITPRFILRWMPILPGILIAGSICNLFEELPTYASAVQFGFLPALVLSGLWMRNGPHTATPVLGAINPMMMIASSCRSAVLPAFSRPRLFFILALSLMLGSLCRAEDFGITHREYNEAGSHTVFTFRKSRLIYERTHFEARPGAPSSWVERFYTDGQPAAIRSGFGAQWSLIHFTGAGTMTRAGRRLTVGSETYDLGDDGLYRLIADPEFMLRQSVIDDPVFSTRTLDAQRKKMIASPGDPAK